MGISLEYLRIPPEQLPKLQALSEEQQIEFLYGGYKATGPGRKLCMGKTDGIIKTLLREYISSGKMVDIVDEGKPIEGVYVPFGYLRAFTSVETQQAAAVLKTAPVAELIRIHCAGWSEEETKYVTISMQLLIQFFQDAALAQDIIATWYD